MPTTVVVQSDPMMSIERELRRDLRAVAALALIVSLAAFVWYWHTGQVLLYGDAVAHIHIARRVFDSITPHLSNFGSVWLPMPHLLTLPFVVNDWMWYSGVGGSIPSMASYIVACIGMFRLVRQFGRRGAGWVATAAFGLNANMLYMQSTAMTEPMYLAALIWSGVYAAQFLNLIWTIPFDPRRLRMTASKMAIALWVAMWTRYDGWFQTAATVVVLGLLVITGSGRVAVDVSFRRMLRICWPAFVLLAVAPILWIAYNAVVFHNPLEFWNGPYSARAIEAKTSPPGSYKHPGYHSPYVAWLYFEKCAKEDVAQGTLGGAMMLLAVVGLAIALFRGRASWVVLLMWVPLIFYSLSVAYGGVPIFLPVWKPWAWYNVRYGMQLLPAIAIGVGLSAQFFAFLFGQPARRYLIYAFIFCIALITLQEWKKIPLTLQEARVNARTRKIFEAKIAAVLGRFRGERMLMYTSEYAGALQDAHIHEADVINESNFRVWDHALADPAHAAKILIAIDHDDVGRAVEQHPQGLKPIAVIESEAKPRTVIYRSSLYAGAQ